MFNVEQWIYAVIAGDSTLATLLASPSGSSTPVNVYPAGVDLVPTATAPNPEQFPAITYLDAGSTLNSTTHMHIGRMQLDYWSLTGMTEIMTIYTRVAQIINFQHSRITATPFNGTLWWIREDMSKDMPDTTRRVWRKMVDYKYWSSNQDLT